MVRPVASFLLNLMRGVVYVPGILLGLTYSATLGLASAAGQFMGVFGGLGLAFAAPYVGSLPRGHGPGTMSLLAMWRHGPLSLA